jgi:hypothetical protein
MAVGKYGYGGNWELNLDSLPFGTELSQQNFEDLVQTTDNLPPPPEVTTTTTGTTGMATDNLPPPSEVMTTTTGTTVIQPIDGDLLWVGDSGSIAGQNWAWNHFHVTPPTTDPAREEEIQKLNKRIDDLVKKLDVEEAKTKKAKKEADERKGRLLNLDHLKK